MSFTIKYHDDGFWGKCMRLIIKMPDGRDVWLPLADLDEIEDVAFACLAAMKHHKLDTTYALSALHDEGKYSDDVRMGCATRHTGWITMLIQYCECAACGMRGPFYSGKKAKKKARKAWRVLCNDRP